MDDEFLEGLKWFAAGFILAAILRIGFDMPHYIPVSVALGLLCFACGVLAMEFVALWKLEKRNRKHQESWNEALGEVAKLKKELETEKDVAIAKAKDAEDAEGYWLDEFNKLEDEKAELEKDKKNWELQKAAWDADKEKVIAKAKAAGLADALIMLAEEGGEGSQNETDRDTHKE